MNPIDELALKQRQMVEPIEWSEPIGFDDVTLPSFDASIFPEWLNCYIHGVSEETQTPIDASGFAAISVLSTILARNYEVKIVGDWIEPLNTYSVVTLDSANRKTAVFKSFTNPIFELEKEIMENMRLEIVKQKDRLNAKQKRIERLENEFAKSNAQSLLDEICSIRDELDKEKIMNLPTCDRQVKRHNLCSLI